MKTGLFLLLFPNINMASFNLTLKPAQTELVALPGSTIIQTYDVTNNSSESLTLSSQVLPWVPRGNDGSVDYLQALPNPHLAFSLTNTDLLLGQTFTLAPGQKRQLVLKIKSDSTVPLTDVYYTFFINQTPGFSTSSTSQSAASGRIGSHLLISYSSSDTPHSQFFLSHVSVSPRFKGILFPQLNISATAENDSPYFAKIQGKLVVAKNGLVIQQFDLFPDNVLANSPRQIRCLSDNQPVPCSLNPPFWPGSYTATLTLDPSLNAPSATVSFFIFPYTLTLILGFVLTLIWYFSRPQKHISSTP